MKTFWKNIIGAAALVGVTTLVTTQVVSQQEAPEGYGADDSKEMWEQWMKLAAPGPEHAKLAKHAGKWDQVAKHWMYPGAEPVVSESTATFKPILGGRFMLEEMKGQMEMNGEKFDFEAMGIIGYDNHKQRHFYAWIDNMGTLMMIGEGVKDQTGDAITYMSELPNPQTGGTIKMKSVSRMLSNDKSVFEMYEQLEDGTWHLQMELTGTRKR